MINKKNNKKSKINNAVSLIPVFGLLIFLALGCSFNFGNNADNTAANDKKTSDPGETDKKDKKDKEEEKPAETPKPTEINKPAPPPPPKKEEKVPPPTGSTVGFSNTGNVVLRDSPSLNGKKIGSLSLRQRLFIISYSDNYDTWRGTEANWAYVQTESGVRGWVFTPFVEE